MFSVSIRQKNINISDMEELLGRIDNYLDIQNKKERISESIYISSDIKEVIELVKKSEDRDKVLSLLDEDVRNKIEKLIEGGLLWAN